MLTIRQREVFDYICRFMQRHGFSPTYQEMGQALQISSRGNISKYVDVLQQQGYISFVPHRARSIRLRRPPGRPISGRPGNAATTVISNLGVIEADRVFDPTPRPTAPDIIVGVDLPFPAECFAASAGRELPLPDSLTHDDLLIFRRHARPGNLAIVLAATRTRRNTIGYYRATDGTISTKRKHTSGQKHRQKAPQEPYTAITGVLELIQPIGGQPFLTGSTSAEPRR